MIIIKIVSSIREFLFFFLQTLTEIQRKNQIVLELKIISIRLLLTLIMNEPSAATTTNENHINRFLLN